MSPYQTAARRIDHALERFRGVNKTFLLAALSGIGAFLGSVIGYHVNPFPYPSFRHLLVWDASIGLGIGLTVAIVQSWHLGRLEVAGKDLLRAAAISTVGGFLGGAALFIVKSSFGFFFGFFGIQLLPHIAGWTAEGIVIAVAVSRAIPNLKLPSALLAGSIAGFLGGFFTGLNLLHVALADAFKGVFIALSIAAVERLVREAWLVVKRDQPAGGAQPGNALTFLSEPPTLLLGEAPIRIGSSSECQVLVSDPSGPPVLAEVGLKNGQVIYEDQVTNRRRNLKDGQTVRVGNVTLEVGTRADGNGRKQPKGE